eukprot:11758767-Karenia_brevis.AAC.1
MRSYTGGHGVIQELISGHIGSIRGHLSFHQLSFNDDGNEDEDDDDYDNDDGDHDHHHDDNDDGDGDCD